MEVILLFAMVLAPVILAVVQLIKSLGIVPKRFSPLVAIIVGLIIGWLAVPFTDLELQLRLWAGFLAGLSAIGLFELTLQKHKVNTDDKF